MVLQQRNKRTLGIATVATLSATMLMGIGTRALADDTLKGSPANAIVKQVTITAAPLAVAIRMITSQTHIDIVFVNKGQQFNTVDVNVTNKPVREVLHQIALSAGAACWEADGVFYIGGKEDAPKPVALPEPLDTREASAPKQVHFEKIKLMYASPRSILKQIGAKPDEMADFAEQNAFNIYRTMMRATNPFGASTPISGAPLVTNNAVSNPNGTLSPANVAAPSVPTASQTSDQGVRRDPELGRGGQFGGGGGGGQFGGGGGGGQFGGGGGGGQFGGGGGAQGGGGGQAGGGGGQGGGQAGGFLAAIGIQANELLAYDADGSIIVQTSDEEALRQLKDLIRLLDVKPRQIMVRAEFVTVLQNDVSSFGINWSLSKINFISGVQTGYQTSNTAFIQYATGNLATQLSWILTTGHGKLVAAPMATTLNNVPATFFNNQQIPYFVSNTTISNGTVFLQSTPQVINATTSLSVLPRINADDTITLFGIVLISALGTPVTGPNGESIPTIITQSAPVQRIIRNGDTMVIGGLTSKNTQVSSNRAPLLGDMPIIGTLFRSRNTTVSDTDLLVFITASIIPERSTTSTLTGPGGAPIGGGAGGGLTPGGSAP